MPHVEALGTLAGELNAPAPDFPSRLREEREFLASRLMPHMAQTEATLYPELERLMQNRHSMTPMRREHEELRALARELDVLGDRPLDLDLDLGVGIRLRRVLYRMHAILLTHLAEEEAYLRVLEHNLSDGEQQSLVRAMEQAVAMSQAPGPAQRPDPPSARAGGHTPRHDR